MIITDYWYVLNVAYSKVYITSPANIGKYMDTNKLHSENSQMLEFELVCFVVAFFTSIIYVVVVFFVVCLFFFHHLQHYLFCGVPYISFTVLHISSDFHS